MSDYQAYLWRPWIDHSSDSFSGLLVTVPAASGALILPALALIVALAGDAAWTIGAYALHQWRARDTPQTGLSRMLQVALRNSGSALGSALEIVQTGHAWGGRVSGARSRAYKLAFWPVIIKVLFVIAGIFVGRVTIAAYKTSSILLTPTLCGLQSAIPSNSSTATFQGGAKTANDTRQSRSYANQCYNAPNGTLGCTSLPIQRLPYTTRANVACPFGNMCYPKSESAFSLDTGLLDSHTHLGINAKPSDRVEFRISTACSVISTKNYTQIVPDPHSNGNYSYFQVDIGLIDGASTNYTWFYTQLEWIQSVPYTASAFIHYSKANDSVSGWRPIPQLNFPDADTSVVFTAANTIMYQKPVFDPMFSANGTFTYADADGTVWYLPDHYFVGTACGEQISLCNPQNGKCSPGLGTNNMIPLLSTDYFGFNNVQLATAQRITLAHMRSHIYDVVNGQGGTALAANSLLSNLLSPGLPDNQWQIEVNSWFQTSLANIQYRIIEFPNNNWAPNTTDSYIGVIAAEDWKDSPGSRLGMMELCNRQLVRSTGEYQSFHVAGILIIAIISGALIITSWTIDYCVRRMRDRVDPNAPQYYKRLAYIADSKQQLLRMALKPAGYADGWEREMKYIPSRRAPDEGIAAPTVRDGAVLISHAPEIQQETPQFVEETKYGGPVVVQGEITDSSTDSFKTGRDENGRLRNGMGH